MLTETDRGHINQKATEIAQSWRPEIVALLSKAEVVEATNNFKKLALRYLEAGMPLDLAVKSADCAALAIATHPHKVMQAMEATGQTAFSPNGSTTIARIGRITKFIACSMIMHSVAREMNILTQPSLNDLEAVFDGGEPNYEETAPKAFQFFMKGLAAEKTLLQ